METGNISSSMRQNQIVTNYLKELDFHMEDIKLGKAEKTFEIKDLAELLFIHPTHLSNTIHQVLGKSPCDIYEERLVNLAKDLLLHTNQPIANIAHSLTFDPSNFTKFFRSMVGTTPKKFRMEHKKTD